MIGSWQIYVIKLVMLASGLGSNPHSVGGKFSTSQTGHDKGPRPRGTQMSASVFLLPMQIFTTYSVYPRHLHNQTNRYPHRPFHCVFHSLLHCLTGICLPTLAWGANLQCNSFPTHRAHKATSCVLAQFFSRDVPCTVGTTLPYPRLPYPVQHSSLVADCILYV